MAAAWLVTVFLCGSVVGTGAEGQQPRPDFTGEWRMDVARSARRLAFHGDYLRIVQSPTIITFTATWVDELGRTQRLPWDLRIDRWGPRRGGDQSRQPLVQARWDGQKLIVIKAPGTGYSAVWIWSLSDDGSELSIESINIGGLDQWAFKEAAIPRAFGRLRHVFTRAASRP